MTARALTSAETFTEAEAASGLYRVKYDSASGHGHYFEFSIVALSDVHALEVGGRRMEHMVGKGALGEFRLTTMQRRDIDPEEWLALHAIETDAERGDRRAEYLTRFSTPIPPGTLAERMSASLSQMSVQVRRA